jgi:hypothetical protein
MDLFKTSAMPTTVVAEPAMEEEEEAPETA